MQVLHELVTVIRELKPIDHWETGKMADVMIFKPGDLPECCTETFVSKPRVTGCTCRIQAGLPDAVFVSKVYKPFT